MSALPPIDKSRLKESSEMNLHSPSKQRLEVNNLNVEGSASQTDFNLPPKKSMPDAKL